MSQQIKYKFLAAFFLVVFSITTIIGFACSIGLDMGYNSQHHVSEALDHCNSGKVKQVSQSHSLIDVFLTTKTNDCCANKVTDNILLDKSLTNSFQLEDLSNGFLSFYIYFYNNPNESVTKDELIRPSQLVRRSWFLHDTSIRIEIQSFQI